VKLRLADPLIGLSGIGDLSREPDPGQAARTCFVACRLARVLDVPDATAQDVFYTALLQHLGCTGYAHDTAAVFAGRDIEMNAAGAKTDFSRPADIFKTFIPELSKGVDLPTRLRIVGAAITKAPRMGVLIARTSCEIAESTARRIGLPSDVQASLRHIAEWYNGKGGYLGRKGEDIPLAARIVLAAFNASIFDALAGPETARHVVSARAGKSLDPAVADAFAKQGADILAELSSIDVVKLLPNQEPDPKRTVSETDLDEVCVAIGEVVDLKTPFTHGSARRAFDLARAAAGSLHLQTAVVACAGRAAALRDIGKAAVSNAILEKPGALTVTEWEHVRLHAYHTERVLERSPVLVAVAKLAGLHHEREDGSGYHRGANAALIPMAARVIAASDALVAMTQPRPYRAAMSLGQACDELEQEAGRGALHADATAAVVAGAQGFASKKPRFSRPAGLTARQVEVLRLVAEGLTNREIGTRLVVSARTAEHHVQDIYTKIGVSSRAGAALFAMEHRLL
jgi:HD-GYP domain-containing protein (c-di-GMP phosphodiesterase class II)